MSGYGIICGSSKRSYNVNLNFGTANYNFQTVAPAGDLCGGGGVLTGMGYRYIRGADGGIGGGGGGGQAASGTGPGNPYSFGGFGGDGIILIQYLPW